MYHLRNGWLFKRDDDGTIKIQVLDSKDDQPLDDSKIISELEIPPEEWSAIVASLSVDGANEANVGLASIFHQYGTDKLMEAILRAMNTIADKRIADKFKFINYLSLSIITFILCLCFCIVWYTIRHF
jgi:hypothetical protein